MTGFTGYARSSVSVIVLGPLAISLTAPGCDRFRPARNQPMPSVAEVERIYHDNGLRDVNFETTDNVVVIRAEQSPEQLQRGGSLWARVGPYIYVFNPGTQVVFDRYPGVAAVRAITTTGGHAEVARATLRRGALNELTWRRALNLLGHAVNDGTRRPGLILELVEWGEAHTRFRYNTEFVPEAGSGT